ncbi:MAG: hypothetical protein ACRDNK_22360 [Solirubrobacteraceae bacterium]
MTPEEWETICLLIEEGWPGEFTDASAAAWRVFLDDYQPEQVLTALKMLVARGGRFRPSVAEVVEQIRSDPGKPTFDEALALIRTALRAYNLPLHGDFETERQMLHARERKVLERADGMHPRVVSFIDRRSVGRLMDEVAEIEDERWGTRNRRDLQAAWEEHCDACEGREVAVLARSGRGKLAPLDPLAALNIGRPKQIESGA